MPANSLWRNIPNAISTARLCAAAILLATVVFHRIEIFQWLFLACLFSDIADGLIARTFHLTSEFGATLDSIADVVTTFIGALGILVFQQRFLSEHFSGLLLVLGFYTVEVLASFWRYRKVSSFHTFLARIAAFVGSTFVMTLFLFGYHAWLFRTTVIVYIVSLSEEMLLIYLLPQWQSDVRGSYWVVKNRLHVPTARWVPTAAGVVALAFIAAILAGDLFQH
jgi:CDP-diacylglycerol--glycerol-3-phosphate 3-phosphatidyltransferase